MKNIIPVGAFMSALGILLGAFGAHGLRGKVEPDLFDIFVTANHYFLLHAFATIFYGLWLNLADRSAIRPWPAKTFWIGSAIFSGSLYAITFTGIRAFGMITPIGGICLIAGWIGFGIQAFKFPLESNR